MAEQQTGLTLALSCNNSSMHCGMPGVPQPFGTKRALSLPETCNEEAKTPEHATAAGGGLLDFPEEILLQILRHFTLNDWAKGPALTCWTLCRMHLPRLMLQILGYKRNGKPQSAHKLFRALRWAAKRLGPFSRSLEIKFNAYRLKLDVDSIPKMERAFSRKADLSSVRCLSFETSPDLCDRTFWEAMGGFQQRLIERTSCIEALRLLHSTPLLARCADSLNNLKHLEMEAHAFVQGLSQASGHLPNLETLYLHEVNNSWLRRQLQSAEINVLGYQSLRQLVVQGTDAQAVLCQPKCQLGIHLTKCTRANKQHESTGTWQQTLNSTRELVIRAGGALDCPWYGIIQHCQNVETLRLDLPPWSDSSAGRWDERRASLPGPQRQAVHEARMFLRNCLLINDLELASLKVLIIEAPSSAIFCIPSGLPKLEELVLLAYRGAEVSFKKPVATFSALKTFYAYGHQLEVDIGEGYMSQVVEDAAERGLLLSTVSADEAEGEDLCFRGSSCMYLRPTECAQEMSIRQLFFRTSRLAKQCRCKACFECLKQAGRLPWCWVTQTSRAPPMVLSHDKRAVFVKARLNTCQ